VWEDFLFRDKSRQKTFAAAAHKAGAKNAVTHVMPLSTTKTPEGCTLAEIEIETGRTHQIRAQAAAHGFPLAGDGKYGSKTVIPYAAARFFLHAWKIVFPTEPETIPLPQSLTAAPPTFPVFHFLPLIEF
jgi:23S rRNA-/tRNA-specific pseudouridylate synthase